jgi:hypothetical protein
MAQRQVQKRPSWPGCAGAVTHNLKGSLACHSIRARHNWTMHDVDSKIGDAVRHAPEWVRHDLLSSDRLTRIRAEETLAAMISNALRLKAA